MSQANRCRSAWSPPAWNGEENAALTNPPSLETIHCQLPTSKSFQTINTKRIGSLLLTTLTLH